MCETLRQKILMDTDYLAELLVWEDTTPEVGFGTIWKSRIVSGKFCSKQEAISATLKALDGPADDCTVKQVGWSTEEPPSTPAKSKPKSKWSCEYLDDKCPECGAPKIGMTNNENGIWFYGCAAYPKCKWHWYPYSRSTNSPHRVDINEWGDIDEIAENFPDINGSELGVDWIGVMP